MLLSLAEEFADRFNVSDKLSESAVERLIKMSQENVSPIDSGRCRIGTDKAVIPVTGTLTDRKSYSEYLGETVSYETLSQCLDVCQQYGIRNIVFDMNSPGGHASGVQNLVEKIVQLRADGYRLTAVVNNLCCSAAYRIACACDKILALPESIIGSIGVNYIMYDTHRQATMRGTEAVVISSSDYKWAGTPGTPITEKQRDNIRQTIVEPCYQQFCHEVQTGRNLTDEETQKACDGRAFRAEQALELKLIDQICNLSVAMESCGSLDLEKGNQMSCKKPTNQTDEQQPIPAPEQQAPTPIEAPVSATILELESAFPNAGAEFYVSQLKQNATLDTAKDAYIALLEEKIVTLQNVPAPAPVPAPTPSPKPEQNQPVTLPGVTPVIKTNESMPTIETPVQSASDKIRVAVEEKVKSGMSEQQAVLEVLKSDPELRKQWILDVNAPK